MARAVFTTPCARCRPASGGRVKIRRKGTLFIPRKLRINLLDQVLAVCPSAFLGYRWPDVKLGGNLQTHREQGGGQYFKTVIIKKPYQNFRR